MKKQTAVEWLVKKLNQEIEYIPLNKWDVISDKIQEALAMEKEQIMEAYKDGLLSQEQYYKETYGKDRTTRTDRMG